MSIKSALDKGQEGGSHYYPDVIKDDSEIYVSEPIFFAIALEYPALKDILFETAQAMAKMSRAHNDTSEMWLDDMRVFGVEALYMLACTYPEYSYLLAQFLIPYWDDEHAVGYEEYLSSLLHTHGWSEDMIKAFVWCDNHFFRQSMHSEENLLGEYLKANPDAYVLFKECIRERFSKELFLLSSDDLEDVHPILEIYFSLFISTEEWAQSIEENEDLLQQHFISDTLENEALDLENELIEMLQTPLIKLSESALAEKQFRKDIKDLQDNYQIGDDYQHVISLFKHLPKGEEICEYVARGKNKEALQALPKVGLLQLAKARTPDFYKLMCYHTSGYRDEKELREELHSIIANVTAEHLSLDVLLDESEEIESNGLIIKLNVRKNGDTEASSMSESEKKQLQERYLRILDMQIKG